MPFEAEKHVRTLMAWPDETRHPASMGYIKRGDLNLAWQEVASIANAISRFEPVWLYAKPHNTAEASRAVSHNVTVNHSPSISYGSETPDQYS